MDFLWLEKNPVDDIERAIRADHDEVLDALYTVRNDHLPPNERQKEFEAIISLFSSSAFAEKKAFYNECLIEKDLTEAVEQSLIEQKIIIHLVDILPRKPNLHDFRAFRRWSAGLKVFAYLLESHIRRENSELVSKISEYFLDDQRQAIAKKYIEARKNTQKYVSRDEHVGVLRDVIPGGNL